MRTAFLVDANLVVFADQITGDQPHTWDIACHTFGQWAIAGDGDPWAGPGGNGYQHLREMRVRPATGGLTLPVQLAPDWSAALVVAPGGPVQVMTGTGMCNRVTERVPAAILRHQGKKATFVWAVGLDGRTGASLTQTATTDGLVVDVQAGKQRWHLGIDTDKPSVTIPQSGRKAWRDSCFRLRHLGFAESDLFTRFWASLARAARLRRYGRIGAISAGDGREGRPLRPQGRLAER